MVDGVIEEQHLCRFDEDGNQRQQAVADQKINACGKYGENGRHKRADNVVAEDGQQHTEDADGEIVDQHFKTGGNVLLHAVVELLDDPACQRAHHHRTHQHGVVRAADAADDGDAGNDAAAFLCDHVAALTGDENGQQVAQHRRDHGTEPFIWEPALFDEQRREETPCNKCTDVRHDHAAQKLAKTGNCVFHSFSTPLSMLPHNLRDSGSRFRFV